MLKRIFSFSNLTLLVALSLSAIAAWYSIAGLTAIFAGAVVPIIIMGSILELSKIVSTVWLKIYWNRANLAIKMYLVPAVFALALLTSMGIFGFLSKAHSDQSLVSGDVIAKISVYDEKIKISKDNIDANRKALKQMDEAVDQVMARSQDEKGADKAVAIRKSQSKERTRLLQDIEAEQKNITKLNEVRAPIAAEVRKVEAEVGPVKYIAALLYGDNPDTNVLEKAVRWVIILIVLVFDPLALMLVLAGNQSRIWDKEDWKREESEKDVVPVVAELDSDFSEEPTVEEPVVEEPTESKDSDPFDFSKHPYLLKGDFWKKPEGWVEVPIPVYTPESVVVDEPITCEKCNSPLEPIPGIGLYCTNLNCNPPVEEETQLELDFNKEPEPEPEPIKELTVNDDITVDSTDPIATEGVTTPKPFKELDGGYVMFDGKHMHMDVLKDMRPDVLKLVADSARETQTSFGTEFPKMAEKGDTFVRVDVLPNRVYKFDSQRWIEVNKGISTSYLHDQEYIKFLIQKIDLGEYDIDLLSESEKQQIEDFLTKKDDK
jgi:hypothetical protein